MNTLSAVMPPQMKTVRDLAKANSKLRIGIHQPGYHRYIGYFYKMLLSDVFISLDTVQYADREWQNRQLFYYNNDLRWLSVPVNNGRTAINEKEIVDHDALLKHRSIISGIYKNTPYFASYKKEFEEVYSHKRKYLYELCDAITLLCKKIMGINTIYINASDFYVHKEKNKGALIADMISQLVGPEYMHKAIYLPRAESPSNNNFYLKQIYDDSDLTEEQKIIHQGVDVSYYHFSHPTYKQHQIKNDFIPNLSIVDLIFNHGPEAIAILSSSGSQ